MRPPTDHPRRRGGARARRPAEFVSRTSLFLFLAVAAAGCDDPLGPEAQTEVASERWDEHGAADYSFVLDRFCECLVTGPVHLTVTADDVVHAEALPGSSAPAGSHPDPEQFPTIDELLAQLRAAAEADPVRFEVEYDPELGYPRSADVDVSAQIADEELSFEVRDVMLFEPLD